MPIQDRIAEIEEHRVKSGETLESIARANGMTWQELARFNWQTTAPCEVNNKLRTVVGATRRSRASQFYAFDNADDPGIILIPKHWRADVLETGRVHTIRVREHRLKPKLLTCCSIPGATFAFDKSFIRSSVVEHLNNLQRALEEHPNAKIIIYGHTDRCGPQQHNKDLSDRRAESVYAFIRDRPDIWERLYNDERWGTGVIQEILKDLGHDPDSNMRTAIRAFQDSKANLVTDGIAGPNTRRELFHDYMTGRHDIRVGEDQFIAPKFMGCGEFNPKVEPNRHELANNGRGRAPGNEPNRRVVFYLFDRPPKNVPCALGSLGPCRTEMAKHEGERNNPLHQCDFYDRISNSCHCERELETPPAEGKRAYYLEFSDDVKLPGDAMLVVEGLEEPMRIPVCDCHDGERGIYLFAFLHPIPGAMCKATIESAQGSSVLFENVDLYALIEDSSEPDSPDPLQINLPDDLFDHALEVEDEEVDHPEPDTDEDDCELPENEVGDAPPPPDPEGEYEYLDYEPELDGEN